MTPNGANARVKNLLAMNYFWLAMNYFRLALALSLLVSVKTVAAVCGQDTKLMNNAEALAGRPNTYPTAKRPGRALAYAYREDGRFRRLFQQPDDNPRVQNVECQLREQDIAGMLNNTTRTWTVNGTALRNVQNDLSAIIDCTQAGDIVLFDVGRQIRPVTRVVIPWNLTLSSLTGTTDLEGGVFPRASKTTFKCSQNGGVFIIRSPDVLIANIAFKDCSLGKDNGHIVRLDRCDSEEARGTVKLHHVTFRRNSLDGASGLSVGQRSCSAVEMVDVVFSDNTCSDVCFARLASENNLRSVKLRKNLRISQELSSQSLILAPSRSSSSIEDLISEKNDLSSLRVTKGNITLVHATFEENEDQPSVLLEGAGRVLVTNSSFRGNTAIRAGAAILTNGTERLSVSNCSFVRNAAERGGAIASTDTDLEIRDCTFQHNVARSHAGAILVEKNALELRSSVFENNSASISGGAIRLVEVSEPLLLDVQCRNSTSESGGCLSASESRELVIRRSVLSNNTATTGGAGYLDDVPDGRIVDTKVESNLASESGAGLFLQNSPGFELVKCTVLANQAGTTGGGFEVHKSRNVTLRECTFESNTASTHGGGAQIADRSSVVIREVNWTENRARRKGGGFSADRSSVISRSSTYSGNQAESGAGSSVEYGSAEFDEDSFVSNNATGAGGGVVTLRTTIALRNCSMIENLGHRGAGLDVLTSEVDIHNVRFEKNRAHTSRGGGLACVESNMNVSDSQFFSNEAANVGGAMDMILCRPVMARNLTIRDNYCQGIGGGIGVTDATNLTLSDSVLVGNSALDSGAVFNQNATMRVTNCTIESNNARTGAAFLILIVGEIILENSTVSSNRADIYGGAIHNEGTVIARKVTFQNNSVVDNGGCLFGRESCRFEISDSFIVNSSSRKGGAIFVRGNGSITLDNTVVQDAFGTESGGGAYLIEAQMTVRRSVFRANSAPIGASAFLEKNSNLHIVDSSFENNEASLSGGSVAATANSTVTVAQAFFSDCSAETGGAFWLSESDLSASGLQIRESSAGEEGGGIFANASSTFSCTDCTFNQNKAAGRGGAVAFESDGPQSLALHLNNCSFTGNSADLGGNPKLMRNQLVSTLVLGAVHVATELRPRGCSRRNTSCTFVAVTGGSFSKNSATRSGGAIFTRDTDVLRYSCSREDTEAPTAQYASDAFRNLEVLSSVQDLCPEWTGNQADVYGPDVASYVKNIRGFEDNGDQTSMARPIRNHQLSIKNHKSGDTLPVLSVEALDGYEQGPPLGAGDDYVEATMHSPGGFFSGEVSMPLKRARNAFPPISGFQRPGFYEIQIDFSEPGLEHFSIEVDVRRCELGESAQENGMLCVSCSGSQYNFDPDAATCTACPEDGNCTTSVIHPNRGYWHRSPCSKHIQECISPKACDFAGREEKLDAVTQEIRSCQLSAEVDKAYSQAQCKKVCPLFLLCNTSSNVFKGYKDVLCGSCDSGYGRTLGYDCRDCYEDPGAAMLFVLSVLILLLLSSFVIRSNLRKKLPHRSLAERASRRNNIRFNTSRKRQVNIPNTLQMVEMLPGTQQSAEIANSDLDAPSEGSKQDSNHAENAKRYVVETFKIIINFLQVIAAAVTINANWTMWMRSLLSSADFLSGAATEGVGLAIDCLVDSDQRSVIRSVVYFAVPLGILAFYMVFWTARTRSSNGSTWYFVKRVLLSFLAVVYLTYLSITRVAVNILYCIEIHDSIESDIDHKTSHWASDTSLKCYEGSHAVLAALVGWPVIIAFSFGVPVVLTYALLKRRTMDAAENLWFFQPTDFLCRAYKDRFIFWESVVLVRKAVLVIVVVFSYPLGTNIQGILAVCILMLATYIHVSCHPFKEEFDSLNTYETASLAVSQFTFASGLFFNDDRLSDGFRALLTVLLSFAICGLFLVLLYKLLKSSEIYLKAVLEAEGMADVQDWGMSRVLRTVLLSTAFDFITRLTQRRPSNPANSESQPSTSV